MDEILQKYEIRKSNKEKTRFIEYIKGRLKDIGYEVNIEEKGRGIFKSRNIIVGNPKEADVVFAAHYDTCAVLPFPNLMSPTNTMLFVIFQIVITILIIAMALAAAIIVALLTDNAISGGTVFLLFLYGFLFYMLFGYRNKHTANDNTSGIITLTHILERLPEEDRNKVCVIYFDNEEKGLFGSAFFYKKHRKQIKDKMLINFDCVGDGENIVTMADKKCRKDEKYQLFTEALKVNEAGADVTYLCKKMKYMMFPSDQMNFKKGIGVCALKKSPVGYYVARIHTYFDTICRKENVEYLAKSMVDFVEKL